MITEYKWLFLEDPTDPMAKIQQTGLLEQDEPHPYFDNLTIEEHV